jgi:outer membrane receptor protein involved in Fe transport
MSVPVRGGLLLGSSALAILVGSGLAVAQTELPEIKVIAPKETPKPTAKPATARKPVVHATPVARPLRIPAPPPISPEQAANNAAQQVISQNKAFDQKITNNLAPALGASTFEISRDTIQSMPGGTNRPLDKVLLQAPGITQDSDVQGGIHIRNEHANIAYRFNGIMLPEGVQGFGQVLESSFIGNMALLTGVLPAQFGLRTAGVLDITTRIPDSRGGGSLQMYGGSHEQVTPNFEYGGVIGQTQYFAVGRYWANDVGLNNTIPAYQAIHDHTAQGRGFAYMSTLLDPDTRISTIFGAWKGKFQIPNTPGQAPQFTVAGVGPFDPASNSATLNENQYENNIVGVTAWQRSTLDYDAQVAYFTRYNSVNFRPDPYGDIVFNGIASNVFRGAFVNGMQGDFAYRLNQAHTLRTGFISSGELTNVNDTSAVLPVDPNTGDIGTIPTTIIDPVSKVGWLAGFYVQDEWKLTNQLTLNTGIRFDQMWQFVDSNQWSPRVNLIYTPWDGTKIHAGYAQYFTPPVQALAGPTNTLAFINTTAQPEVLQNSPVLPERSYVFDVGATQQFRSGQFGNFELGVDGYYKRAKDLIDDGQFGAAYVLTAFNYEKGENYGVEWTAKYNNGPFSAYTNWAWAVQRATNIVSNQQLFGVDELAYIAHNWVFTDHAQTWTVSGGLAYNWAGTRFSADMIYGSGLRAGDFNLDHVPAYGQVNLGVARDIAMPGDKPITVRLDVINVADSTYFIRNGSGIGVFAPQFGPRRGFFVGVSQKL